MKSALRAAAVAVALSATSVAQPQQFSAAVRGFIKKKPWAVGRATGTKLCEELG